MIRNRFYFLSGLLRVKQLILAIVTVMSLAAGDIQFVWSNVDLVVLVSVIIEGNRLEHWNIGTIMTVVPASASVYMRLPCSLARCG